jgi:hypothetical protein
MTTSATPSKKAGVIPAITEMIRDGLGLVRTIWSKFDSWFCTPAPVEGIAIVRILLGAVLIYNAILQVPDCLHYFSSQGIMESTRPNSFLPVNVFYFTGNSPFWIKTWLWIHIALGGLVMVGLMTRITTILAWATLCSFHNENWYIINSGDVMLHLMTFLMIFSPAGNAYSIDAWIANKRGKPLSRTAWPWAQRLLQFQVSYLYLSTFIYKSQGNGWADGHAVYYTSRLWSFERLDLPYIYDHLWAMKLLSWGTLLVEFSLGTLVWIPALRIPVIIAGILLHLGIEWTMNIPGFEFVMITGLVAMLEPSQGLALGNWFTRNRSFKPTRQYPKGHTNGT